MQENRGFFIKWSINLAKEVKDLSLKDATWVILTELKKFRSMSDEEKKQIPEVDTTLLSNVEAIFKAKNIHPEEVEEKMQPSRTSIRDIIDAFRIVYYCIRILKLLFEFTSD